MKKPGWLLRQTVLALHQQSLAAFGGMPGIRDESLLDSALARPQNLWAYGEKPTLYQLGAAYGYGLCKNHPFVDGNKRIAFLSTAVFLSLNGLIPVADEPEVVAVMKLMAAGEMTEDGFAKWLERAFR